MSRFNVELDNNNGVIHFEIDGHEHKLGKIDAFDLKYRLFQVISQKMAWDDIHHFKLNTLEDIE